MFGALQELAEQDPLITVRQDDETRRISVRLYGEVRKEIIAETLATQHGLDVELGSLPLAFHKAIEETVDATLRRGPSDREVIDCEVTVTHTGYFSPVNAAGDFRKATPLVLGEALREAGTEVLEPVSRIEVELPAGSVTATLSRLVERGGTVTGSAARGDRAELTGVLPAGEVTEFEQQLPGLTRGEGLMTTEPAGHRPRVSPNRPMPG